MSARSLVRSRGVRRITAGLGTLDREVFSAVADSPSPLLDASMPVLTRAADHSKLWLLIGAALAAGGSASARRGAARGVLSLGATSLLTNQVAKRIWVRRRPDTLRVPLVRRAPRLPASSSLPSGHSASAAAFAVGVGLESPPLGLALALLAGLVGLSRVATGAHYPGDVFAGFGIGAGVAVLGGRIVPRITGAQLRTAEPLRLDTPPRPTGKGVVLVVNPASGSAAGVIDRIRTALPETEIVELAAGDDPQTVLRAAAGRAEVLAVAGGDGTVSAAAQVAVDSGLPLAVFPAGTFNHFAKDIGCDTVERTVEALRAGSVGCIDLVCLNEEHAVVNTASIGAYPRFVRTRERLEHRLGKTLAGIYATAHTVLYDEPVRIRFDGREVQTSLFFLGNSVYLPSGFAPARRSRMDDGLIDVRILETGRPWSRTRIVTALLLGRLERSPLYHEFAVPEFSFEVVGDPAPIARDGEVGHSHRRATFHARYRALAVFRPSRSAPATGRRR